MDKESGLFDATNRKVPGPFSIERPEFVISAFASPRPKSWAAQLLYNPTLSTTLTEAHPDPKTAKGLRRNADGSFDLKKAKSICREVVRNQMIFEEYVRVILQKVSVVKNMASITSKLHAIYTTIMEKMAMSYYEDKMCWEGRHEDEEDERMRSEGIFSRPHGFIAM
jgi:hypothetical protein